MTRIGPLMLRGGDCNEAQVMPKGWSHYITTLVTPPQDIHPAELGAWQRDLGGGDRGLVVGVGRTDLARHSNGPLLRRIQRVESMAIHRCLTRSRGGYCT